MSDDSILLDLRDVTKHFRKGAEVIRAVDGVTMKIMRGDFVSIRGPSGSGKSTLLHLMGALDWPSQGEVWFGGQDMARMRDGPLSALRRERVGFVFQSFNLISDVDVLENVALPLKYAKVGKAERERRARAALDTMDMGHRLNHRPGELSGGEEQRVAIARALVNHPDVILADEPTGNLDVRNRDVIVQLLLDLNRSGQTVVVVTHDLAVADAASRQVTMQDGHLQC